MTVHSQSLFECIENSEHDEITEFVWPGKILRAHRRDHSDFLLSTINNNRPNGGFLSKSHAMLRGYPPWWNYQALNDPEKYVELACATIPTF